jgi:hypothetical protein
VAVSGRKRARRGGNTPSNSRTPRMERVAQVSVFRSFGNEPWKVAAMRLLVYALVMVLGACGLVLAQQDPNFNERFGTVPPVELSPTEPSPARDAIPPSTEAKSLTDVQRDAAVLPPPVADMRRRLLDAARTGDLAAVQRLITENPVRVKIDEQAVESAVLLWRSQYPDSDGLEALSILIDTLETGFVRVDVGTPNEMYVWPYFAQVPLNTLGPPEIVELLRLVTAYDHQQMLDSGSWTFFRIGISPNGTWHYFVAGE